ncbi:metal-dependent hydrolase [Caldovatus aquaticus]|uniref:metal-dependent hydrolase n=1 Tax=Caldovatus aquaticus TaxID=2865671 RepID=UPI0021066068|nr:metal-dependent hydrolase [Caldovatus aquaticus]
MKITWFGHSAFRLEFGSSVVLIDPFLTGNPAFAGDPEAASAGATHVLLSHGHSDHVGDAVAICKRTGAKLVANYDLCMWLGRQGVEKMDPMNTGGTTDQGEFAVSLTIAFHSSGVLEQNGMSQHLGLPNGVVVAPKAKGEPVVYHMGDTEIFSDMALIGELHQPTVAMVPVGDRFTMGPRSAAVAVKRFLPSVTTAIPCHYATFGLLLPDASGFVAEMQGAKARVLVPEKGVPVTL